MKNKGIHLLLSDSINVRTKKGRKTGSYNKDNVIKEVKNERLNLRVTPTTITQLEWIKNNSRVYAGKSYNEIISILIDDHVLMQQLF